MTETIPLTYEKIYFSLWELAQRYHLFTEFRVIGESHDGRMIPMLEIGEGDLSVFCLGGVQGTEQWVPGILLQMAKDYCQAYECGWTMEELYHVQKLLQRTRLCIIPLLNPDGYEISRRGCRSVRNPIYRQMLKMQRIPREEFTANARAVDLEKNFPTASCVRKRMGEEPASENETKALMRILQEYPSRGMLSFTGREEGIVHYYPVSKFSYNQRSSHLARHLQKCAGSSEGQGHAILKKNSLSCSNGAGSPKQYYAERIRQPSLEIKIPCRDASCTETDSRYGYEKIRLLPLEYLYSLDE